MLPFVRHLVDVIEQQKGAVAEKFLDGTLFVGASTLVARIASIPCSEAYRTGSTSSYTWFGGVRPARPETAMSRSVATAVVVVALAGSSAALAQGHVAGAAVGAVAGAPSHHAVAGAVVGGAVGHHMAKTKAKKAAKAPK